MQQKEKTTIVEHLAQYVKLKGSQNKAAATLKGVSGATLSHLLNGNWEPYSDDMFRKVAAQIGYNANEWQFAPTTNAKDLMALLEDSKMNSLVFAVVGNAGTGKSETTKKYANETTNVFRVECGQYWDRKYFLNEILHQLGERNPSQRIAEMMRDIVLRLKKMDRPQLIIDEVDKLDDKVLLFLITLYNELKGHCSIIILATYFLKKRIHDGLRLRKKGYEEIYSRFGGNFYELEQTSAADIKSVCNSNGVEDADVIRTIARNAGGDLRAVFNSVQALQIDERRKTINHV